MKEEIIAKIDREILAEQLFFIDRDTYSELEQQLMLEVIEKRLKEDYSYYRFGFGYFNKLVNVCGEENLSVLHNGMLLLAAEGEKSVSESHDVKKKRLYYINFLCNERYGVPLRSNFNYQKLIKYNLWTATKIARVKDSYFELLKDDIDFIITNNIFFERYPEFFDDHYVECLEIITRPRKISLPKEEKKELKKAIKILDKNINEYKEIKGLNVKKKTLFQKIIKK